MVEQKQQYKKKVSFDKDRLELLPEGGFRLLGQKCKECGTTVLGRHPACLKCHSRQVEQIELGQSGTLTNYSVVHIRPSSEWKGPVPYALSEVQLPEGPVVTTLTSGIADFKDLKIGMKMKLELQKADEDQEGNEIIIYTWKPANVR